MRAVEPSPVASPALRRALGRWDLTSLGLNAVIGAGVFLVPSQLAAHVGTWAPIAIGLAGVATLAVALCFAEVGSRFDRTGGPYVYTRAAFGPFVGFQVGWMYWFTRVTSIASIVNGLALALAFYWPALADGWRRALLISVVLLTLTVLNVRGVRQGALAVNVFTVAKLLPLLVFVVTALLAADFGRLVPLPAVGVGDAASAGLLLIFLFGGFDAVCVVAGEARNPRRDLPIALVVTTLIVTVLMILVQVSASTTLADLGASKTPLADAAMAVMGPAGAALIGMGSAVSMGGHNAGGLMFTPRILFALADHGELPRRFARIHPRWRTPDVAIWFTAAVTLALALSGSFALLAAGSAVTRLLTYVGVSAATLALRRPGLAVVVPAALFVVPLGSFVPIVAIVVSLAIVLAASPDQWVFGAGALTVGSLLYLSGRAARRSVPARAVQPGP